MPKPKLKLKEIIDRFPKAARDAIKKEMPDFDKAEMERHTCQTEIKEVGKDRKATIYLSTRVVDRDDDIVTPDGWNLKDYLLNSIGLWAHNSSIPAVYKADETVTDDFGLLQRITFAETTFANDLWLLVKGGFLKTFSAGFRSNDASWRMDDGEAFDLKVGGFMDAWPELTEADATRCDRIITEKTLFESTICNVPSNPMALVLSLDEGKMALEDETKEALKIEEFIQKGVDSGLLGKKFARTKHKAVKKVDPKKTITDKSDESGEGALKLKHGPGIKAHEEWLKANPKNKESEPSVKEIPLEIKDATGLRIGEGLHIKEVISQESIENHLASSVKKAIDKSRGAV